MTAEAEEVPLCGLHHLKFVELKDFLRALRTSLMYSEATLLIGAKRGLAAEMAL